MSLPPTRSPGGPTAQTSVALSLVSKHFAVYDAPQHRLAELLSFRSRIFHRNFIALDQVTAQVWPGETFCIIGSNGAGKSTLLQIIAGILTPTSGQVEVSGRVAALLELGAGFNPEFTGRENAQLSATIRGIDFQKLLGPIQEFAEIGSFFDQPVKTYSSGMLMRLGFAVAIQLSPEILIVDEALAVGDLAFRQKCMHEINRLRSSGTTILFVSHAIGDIKAIGDRCLWLERGRVRRVGKVAEVVPEYLLTTTQPAAATSRKPAKRTREQAGAEVLAFQLTHSDKTPIRMLQTGATLIASITVQARTALADAVIGFNVHNRLGLEFCGASTWSERRMLPVLEPSQRVTVSFRFSLPQLYASEFAFTPWIGRGSHDRAFRMEDWLDDALVLPMAKPQRQIYGYVHLPSTVRHLPGAHSVSHNE